MMMMMTAAERTLEGSWSVGTPTLLPPADQETHTTLTN